MASQDDAGGFFQASLESQSALVSVPLTPPSQFTDMAAQHNNTSLWQVSPTNRGSNTSSPVFGSPLRDPNVATQYSLSSLSPLSPEKRTLSAPFLSSPQTNAPRILRLPLEIRHRIYEHINSAGACDNHRDLANKFDARHFETEETRRPRLPWYNLLFSCRAIYDDLSAFVYSRNKFIIRGGHANLRSLTPHALASLTHLTVILYQNDDDGLKPSTDPHNTVLTRWHNTVKHLSPHITPGRLDLVLVCDVDAYAKGHADLANSFLVTLLRLPRLRTCRIRISNRAHPLLSRRADDASFQACGQVPPWQRFSRSGSSTTTPHLTNLPVDILLLILSYTDLVTPSREIAWSRHKRRRHNFWAAGLFAAHSFFIQRRDCARHPRPGRREFVCCSPRTHHACRFLRCREPTFCRRRYSASASACVCWAPPTDLFLICRGLSVLASYTLYTSNRLVLLDVPDPRSPYRAWPPGETYYPYETLAASHFFTRVLRPRCRPFLREVELVFAPFTHGTGLLRDAAHAEDLLADWEAVVRGFVRGPAGAPPPPALRPDLPPLRVRVTVLRQLDNVRCLGAYHWGSMEAKMNMMTPRRAKRVLEVYKRLCTPFRQWVGYQGEGAARRGWDMARARELGLQGFSARLASPWRWAPWATSDEGGAWLAESERRLKTAAEVGVWGKRYEERGEEVPLSVVRDWDRESH